MGRRLIDSSALRQSQRTLKVAYGGLRTSAENAVVHSGIEACAGQENLELLCFVTVDTWFKDLSGHTKRLSLTTGLEAELAFASRGINRLAS
jgi:hypothetical protein